MNNEEWLPISEYEGHYEVSSLGRVRSLDRLINRNGRPATLRGTELHASVNPVTGYASVNLWRDGVRRYRHVHRLVAETFLGDPLPGQEVCHANGVREDNRLVNLRWGTSGENHLDAVAGGTHFNARKDVCNRGHPYTPENTYSPPSRPTWRQCRVCILAASRARYAKNR